MKIVLVRHAQTAVDPKVVSTEWALSEKGRSSAIEIANDPAFQGADAVYSSSQPKAIQTAQIIANIHDLENTAEDGLAELSSITRGFIDDYTGTLHRLYSGEIDSINGGETLSAALERFSRTIMTIVSAHSQASKVIVVSHANVLSLFSAEYCDERAIDLHDSINMPDIAVLEWSDNYKKFDRLWGDTE